MSLLLSERIRNNDKDFFRKFTNQREQMESFLIGNKSLIGIILQNLNKSQRVPKMRDMLAFLISEGGSAEPLKMMEHIGLQGRIFDVVSTHVPREFTDETKAMTFLRKALQTALVCPICRGKLDPRKSVHYDHIKPKRDGGAGDPENCDLLHPYCDSTIKG
jgi:hypothetical protein